VLLLTKQYQTYRLQGYRDSKKVSQSSCSHDKQEKVWSQRKESETALRGREARQVYGITPICSEISE